MLYDIRVPVRSNSRGPDKIDVLEGVLDSRLR